MEARSAFHSVIKPFMERYLTASGVTFGPETQDLKALEGGDGRYAFATAPLRCEDGCMVTLAWGVGQSTHLDWEGMLPQSRSGAAFASLAFRGSDGKDLGYVAGYAKYGGLPFPDVALWFEGWYAAFLEPFSFKAKRPTHPEAVRLAARHGLRPGDHGPVGRPAVERMLAGFADFAAAKVF